MTGEARSVRWVVPERVVTAERPGGGGRSHRRARREREIAWWREQGVRGVVSGMRTRHSLVEYGLAGLAIRWCPLTADPPAAEEVAALVDGARQLVDEVGCVLVHVDRANEWLAGIDAALAIAFGVADDPRDALIAACSAGRPLGPLAEAVVAVLGAPRVAATITTAGD